MVSLPWGVKKARTIGILSWLETHQCHHVHVVTFAAQVIDPNQPNEIIVLYLNIIRESRVQRSSDILPSFSKDHFLKQAIHDTISVDIVLDVPDAFASTPDMQCGANFRMTGCLSVSLVILECPVAFSNVLGQMARGEAPGISSLAMS